MIPYSRPKLSDLYTLSQSKLFQIKFGHTGHFFFNFSDPISICMLGENCFAIPNQQLKLVYSGAGA